MTQKKYDKIIGRLRKLESNVDLIVESIQVIIVNQSPANEAKIFKDIVKIVKKRQKKRKEVIDNITKKVKNN